MPTYENICCECGHKFEWLAPRFTSPDPKCQLCLGESQRQISAPAIIWSRRLVDYGSNKLESYGKDQKAGGHWMYRKKSGKAAETGVAEPVWIENHAQQRSFCRDEGLIPPSDMPSNISIAKDGASFETANKSEI